MADIGIEVSRYAAALPERSRGVALMACGALLFAVMGALAKGAAATIPTFELVCARSAVTLLAMEVLRRKLAVPLQFRDVPMLASRTVGGFVAISCYFHSLRFIPLGEAVLLNSMSPVLTSVAAVWLLHEHMTWAKAAGLAVSLGGLWLLLGGREVGSLQGQGALLGAASAIASSWALISLKKAQGSNRSLLIVWALAAVCVLGSLLFVDSSWRIPGWYDAALLLGTGAAAAGAQLLMTSGYRLLEATEASVYGFMTPVFAMALGIAWFGEWPSMRAALGGAAIVGAGAGVAWFTGRSAEVGSVAK